jgi:hypothetical protein
MTQCNNPPCYDNNSDHRCNFFFGFTGVGTRGGGETDTMDSMSPPNGCQTHPRQSQQDDTRRMTSNCKKGHPRPRHPTITSTMTTHWVRYRTNTGGRVHGSRFTISTPEGMAFILSPLLRRERRSDKLLAVCSGRN